MLDITVKTLNGRNHSFTVADDITVKQFKDEIAQTIAIDSSVQRLIFQGRVLIDDKKINEYDVNGKTIHVVQRLPPQSHPANDQSIPEETETFRQAGNSLFLGPITVQADGNDQAPNFENIFQQVFGAIAGSRNRPEGGSETANSGQSNANETRINQADGRLEQAKRMLRVAKFSIDKLENVTSCSSTLDSNSKSEDSKSNESEPNNSPIDQSEQSKSDTPCTSQNETSTLGTATNTGNTEPGVSQLAPILDEMLDINNRLQAHIVDYRDILNRDPNLNEQPNEISRCQQICELTSKAMHSVSHAMHNLSDLIVDMSAPPPRYLKANTMPLPQPTAIIQQTIPVQVSAQFNVSAMPMESDQAHPPTSGAASFHQQNQQRSNHQPPNTSASQRLQFYNSGRGNTPGFFQGNPHEGIRIRAPTEIQFDLFGGNNPPSISSDQTNMPPSSQGQANFVPGFAPGAPPGFPPPDFFQNLIQMATGAAMRSGASQLRGQAPQVFMMSSNGTLDPLNTDHRPTTGAASNSQQTSATNSQQQTSQATSNQQTQTSQGTQGTAIGSIPHMSQAPSFMSQQLHSSADPFLVCHSRHFSSRRHQQQGGEPLAGVVSNIVSSLIQNDSVENTSAPSAESPIPPNLFAEILENPNVEANPVVSRLLQGMISQMTQAATGQPTRPISHILETMGNEFNMGPGEGLFADIFQCISNHFTFPDLLNIYLGQTQILDRLRQPLATFVSTQILHLPHHSIPTNEDDIKKGVNVIVELTSLTRNHILTDQATVREQPGVDFNATMVAYIRDLSYRLINLICNSTSDEGFGQQLYTMCHQGVQNMLCLMRLSIEGGNSSVEAIIRNLFLDLVTESNEATREWMVSMMLIQVRQMLSSDMPENDVSRFIVRKRVSPNLVSTQILMEVDNNSPSSSTSFQSFSGDEVVDHMDFDAPPNIKEQMRKKPIHPHLNADLLAHLPKPPTDFDDFDETQFGSEDWHTVVPREWVPVIMRDSIRQHQQHGSNPPLSEAYLAGVPQKRRKMMKSDRKMDFADVHVALPEAVERAANEIGAVPTTSMVRFMQDIANDQQLVTAFQHEVENRLCQRLITDPNYTVEKYPASTERFLNKKHD